MGTTDTQAGGGVAQTVRDAAYRKLDDQKNRATDVVDNVAGAVRNMSQPLRDSSQNGIANYVDKAADRIERWAAELREKDLADVYRNVEDFARRQPALFLGIAFSAGVLAARFLKSSSDSPDQTGRAEGMTYGGRPGPSDRGQPGRVRSRDFSDRSAAVSTSPMSSDTASPREVL
jgi:hypothetical protein